MTNGFKVIEGKQTNIVPIFMIPRCGNFHEIFDINHMF